MYSERHNEEYQMQEESFEQYYESSDSGGGQQDDLYNRHKCNCGCQEHSRKKPCGHSHQEEFWCKCYKKSRHEPSKCGCPKPCRKPQKCHKSPCSHSRHASLEEQYEKHFNCCKPHCKKVCPCCKRSY